MLTRRSFVKLLVGAVAGMFAGKVGAVEAAQPATSFTGKITDVQVHDHALSLTELWELFYQDPEDNIAPLVEALMAEKARPAKSQWIHVVGAETKLTDRLVTFWSGGQIVYPHIMPGQLPLPTEEEHKRRWELYGPPRRCWPQWPKREGAQCSTDVHS